MSKPWRFQFRLSSAMAAMLAAGFLMWLSLHGGIDFDTPHAWPGPIGEQCFGWPYPIYERRLQVIGNREIFLSPVHPVVREDYSGNLTADIMINLALIIIAAFGTEWCYCLRKDLK